MAGDHYCYTFNEQVDLEDVDSSLLLSVWACESLHGKAAIRLELKQTFDRSRRQLLIDATSEVGRDLNRILTGFLLREFRSEDFRVSRGPVAVAAAHN